MGKKQMSGTRAHERKNEGESENESERERETETERERDGSQTPTTGHSKHTKTNLTQKYYQGVILQNYENKLYENKFWENYLQKITHSARNS